MLVPFRGLNENAVASTQRNGALLMSVNNRVDEPLGELAEPPELPIPRGTAGPAMPSDTLVRRWADHQPLNRLEGIYACEGLDPAKSTLSTWHDHPPAFSKGTKPSSSRSKRGGLEGA